MKEIDVSSVKENVLTEKEHFFHEGAFLQNEKGCIIWSMLIWVEQEDPLA